MLNLHQLSGERSAFGEQWTPGICFECGGDTPDRGTDRHPPLCPTCADLWYGEHERDFDCRSIV